MTRRRNHGEAESAAINAEGYVTSRDTAGELESMDS